MINALVLCGAIPVYVNPEVDNRLGISLGMEVSEVEKAIVANPDAVAVLVNNPTYYGICSDLRSIVKIAHAHNMLVLVDEAHGTHLYFGENLPVCAMDAGADMASVSMHKSGGSLTQSSLLHVGSDRVDLGRLEACLHMVQSTSPSYLLMTSLDAARYELALHGEEMLQRGLALAQMAREAMKKIPGITCVGEASRGKAIYDLDLVRLVMHWAMERFDRKAETLLHGEGPVNRRLMAFCGLFFDTFWYLPDAVNEDLESRYEDIWKEWESYRESKFDDMVALLKEGVDKGEYRKVNLPVVRQCVFYAAQGLTDPAFLREMNMTGKDVLEILEDIMLKGLEKQDHGQGPAAPVKEGEKSR